MTVTLLQRHGTNDLFSIFQNKSKVTVGCGDDCDVHVKGRHVASHHCDVLILAPHGTVVVANKENNLTYIDNVLLDDNGALCELPVGGCLSLGVSPDIARTHPDRYVLLKLLTQDRGSTNRPTLESTGNARDVINILESDDVQDEKMLIYTRRGIHEEDACGYQNDADRVLEDEFLTEMSSDVIQSPLKIKKSNGWYNNGESNNSVSRCESKNEHLCKKVTRSANSVFSLENNSDWEARDESLKENDIIGDDGQTLYLSCISGGENLSNQGIKNRQDLRMKKFIVKHGLAEGFIDSAKNGCHDKENCGVSSHFNDCNITLSTGTAKVSSCPVNTANYLPRLTPNSSNTVDRRLPKNTPTSGDIAHRSYLVCSAPFVSKTCRRPDCLESELFSAPVRCNRRSLGTRGCRLDEAVQDRSFDRHGATIDIGTKIYNGAVCIKNIERDPSMMNLSFSENGIGISSMSRIGSRTNNLSKRNCEISKDTSNKVSSSISSKIDMYRLKMTDGISCSSSNVENIVKKEVRDDSDVTFLENSVSVKTEPVLEFVYVNDICDINVSNVRPSRNSEKLDCSFENSTVDIKAEVIKASPESHLNCIEKSGGKLHLNNLKSCADFKCKQEGDLFVYTDRALDDCSRFPVITSESRYNAPDSAHGVDFVDHRIESTSKPCISAVVQTCLDNTSDYNKIKKENVNEFDETSVFVDRNDTPDNVSDCNLKQCSVTLERLPSCYLKSHKINLHASLDRYKDKQGRKFFIESFAAVDNTGADDINCGRLTVKPVTKGMGSVFASSKVPDIKRERVAARVQDIPSKPDAPCVSASFMPPDVIADYCDLLEDEMDLPDIDLVKLKSNEVNNLETILNVTNEAYVASSSGSSRNVSELLSAFRCTDSIVDHLELLTKWHRCNSESQPSSRSTGLLQHMEELLLEEKTRSHVSHVKHVQALGGNSDRFVIGPKSNRDKFYMDCVSNLSSNDSVPILPKKALNKPVGNYYSKKKTQDFKQYLVAKGNVEKTPLNPDLNVNIKDVSSNLPSNSSSNAVKNLLHSTHMQELSAAFQDTHNTMNHLDVLLKLHRDNSREYNYKKNTGLLRQMEEALQVAKEKDRNKRNGEKRESGEGAKEQSNERKINISEGRSDGFSKALKEESGVRETVPVREKKNVQKVIGVGKYKVTKEKLFKKTESLLSDGKSRLLGPPERCVEVKKTVVHLKSSSDKSEVVDVSTRNTVMQKQDLTKFDKTTENTIFKIPKLKPNALGRETAVLTKSVYRSGNNEKCTQSRIASNMPVIPAKISEDKSIRTTFHNLLESSNTTKFPKRRKVLLPLPTDNDGKHGVKLHQRDVCFSFDNGLNRGSISNRDYSSPNNRAFLLPNEATSGPRQDSLLGMPPFGANIVNWGTDLPKSIPNTLQSQLNTASLNCYSAPQLHQSSPPWSQNQLPLGRPSYQQQQLHLSQHQHTNHLLHQPLLPHQQQPTLQYLQQQSAPHYDVYKQGLVSAGKCAPHQGINYHQEKRRDASRTKSKAFKRNSAVFRTQQTAIIQSSDSERHSYRNIRTTTKKKNSNKHTLSIRVHATALEEYLPQMTSPYLLEKTPDYVERYLEFAHNPLPNNADQQLLLLHTCVRHVCDWNFDWLMTYQVKFETKGVWSPPPEAIAWPPVVVNSGEENCKMPSFPFVNSDQVHSTEYVFFNTLMYYQLWEKVYWDWRQPDCLHTYILCSYVESVSPYLPSGSVRCAFLSVSITTHQTSASHYVRSGDLVRVCVSNNTYFAYVDRAERIAQSATHSADYQFTLLFSKDVSKDILPSAMLSVTFVSHVLPLLRSWEKFHLASFDCLAKGFASVLKERSDAAALLASDAACDTEKKKYKLGDLVWIGVNSAKNLTGDVNHNFRGPFRVVSSDSMFVSVKLSDQTVISTHINTFLPFKTLCQWYLENFQLTASRTR